MSINDAGQIVGHSEVNYYSYATEWIGGSVINLGGLPGSTYNAAFAINDAGQVVGASNVGSLAFAAMWSPSDPNAASAVPEPSTWAMMLLGLAGLGLRGTAAQKQAHNAGLAQNIGTRS